MTRRPKASRIVAPWTARCGDAPRALVLDRLLDVYIDAREVRP